MNQLKGWQLRRKRKQKWYKRYEELAIKLTNGSPMTVQNLLNEIQTMLVSLGSRVFRYRRIREATYDSLQLLANDMGLDTKFVYVQQGSYTVSVGLGAAAEVIQPGTMLMIGADGRVVGVSKPGSLKAVPGVFSDRSIYDSDLKKPEPEVPF